MTAIVLCGLATYFAISSAIADLKTGVLINA